MQTCQNKNNQKVLSNLSTKKKKKNEKGFMKTCQKGNNQKVLSNLPKKI